MKTKIYICHYPPLLDRKKHLDEVLPGLEIPFIFCSNFNRENISKYENLFSSTKENLYKKGWTHPQAPQMTASIKATTLEHAKIYEQILQEEDPNTHFIVLEDDAVIPQNFKQELQHVINNLPPDWDIVHFSSGCGGRQQFTDHNGTNLVFKQDRTSWTANGYLLNQNTAQKLVEHIYPICLPIDFELNFIQNYLQMNVYWTVTPLVYEGSNPAAGSYYKYTTSQIR